MKAISLIASAAAALLIFGCARHYSGPRAVFMGDSITQGWNTPGTGHPEFFSGNGYTGKGISGQTTTMMLARFKADVVDLDPGCAVICAGVNDIAGNDGFPRTTEEIVANIAAMAEMAADAGIPVIICSATPCDYFFWAPSIHPETQIIELNKALKEYAVSHGFTYADYWSVMSNPDGGPLEGFTIDGCHPSPQGYDVMEAVIVPVIDRVLKP